MQQEHCKSLTRRLQDEAASRRDEAALRDRSEREMQEQWEGTLEGLQREKTALKQRVQARARPRCCLLSRLGSHR